MSSPADPTRILSESMRPRCFADLVGQEDIVKRLITQFKSRRVPHFYILAGPIGGGKTTLAWLIALALQQDVSTLTPETDLDYLRRGKYDIEEINAAKYTGIDSIRTLTDKMRYAPRPGSRCKVVILDESHQLSKHAQNALLTEVEGCPKTVYYIFCTSSPTDVIPALRDRARPIQPHELNRDGIFTLLRRAAEFAMFTGPIEPLVDLLLEHAICAPRAVLQSAERYFCGTPLLSSVMSLSSDPSGIEPFAVARKIAIGDWKSARTLLTKLDKGNVYYTRMMVLNYLKSILLKETGAKAVNLSKAIEFIAKCSLDDGASVASLAACLCVACEYLKPAVAKPKPSGTSSTTTTSK